MGFIKDLIGLTIVGTASKVIDSKLTKRKIKNNEKKLECLEKLKELYDAGIITKKEYERKKKEILSS